MKHFATYVRENAHPLQLLTDSKLCQQAYQRLCKGYFSASARVSTFLSCLISHNVQVLHIPGKSNASSDNSSRHPRECYDSSCKVCAFVNNTATSVHAVMVSYVMSGSISMPYKNTSAWKSAQHQCPDLRRAYAHLTQSRNLRQPSATTTLLQCRNCGQTRPNSCQQDRPFYWSL